MKQHGVATAARAFVIVVAVLAGHAARGEISAVDVRLYVNDTYRTVSGLDALLDRALSQQ